MKIAYLILVLLHGLIHLLGFIKAYEIKAIKELSLPISKTAGLVWLLAFLIFLAYAGLHLASHQWSWLLGLMAVLLSQVLVFYFWKDAKVGSIPNLIILLVCLVQLGNHLIYSEFTARVRDDFQNNNTMSTAVLTLNDIAHLPPIVQDYLKVTKSVGQPRVKNFRVEFSGGMRSAPDEAYMQLESVQYNFYDNPSRYFYMEATKMGLPATGLHLYENQTATFEVKMLNWFTVVNARGEKMDQAETVTIFNDMCMIAPATLIDNRITWESIDDNTVRAFFQNGKIRISADLYFNEKGELINFISDDRYHTDGKIYKSYPWATPVYNYQMISGYWLPSRAELIYQKPEGDFVYGVLKYEEVLYNLEEFQWP